MDWKEEVVSLRPYLRKVIAINLRGMSDDADDVLGEAYLRIFRIGYDPTKGCTVKTWATNIARASVWEHFRSAAPTTRAGKKKLTTVACEEVLDPLGQQIEFADLHDLYAALHDEWGARHLQKALERLPERWQRVVYWREDGLTYREIGKMLGVSESRVYQIAQSVAKTMRPTIERLGYAC